MIALSGAGWFLTDRLVAGGHWHDGGQPLRMVERNSLVMGSVISFSVIAGTKQDGYHAINEALNVFHRIEKSCSMYRDDSETSQIGRWSGREAVSVSEDTLAILSKALEVYKQSEGYFDITVNPALRRWGFRSDPDAPVIPPTDEERKRLEQVIGTQHLIIEDGKVYLNKKGMSLDVGGIAGGYALDQAIAVMKKCSIAAAFINFSGDLHCFGRPASGTPWTARLYDPVTQSVLSDPVELHDEALSTSGSYQNRRSDGHGHSWGHLFLPAEAEPVAPCASLTAIHPSAMTADAWSTAEYVGAKSPGDVKVIRLKG